MLGRYIWAPPRPNLYGWKLVVISANYDCVGLQLLQTMCVVIQLGNNWSRRVSASY